MQTRFDGAWCNPQVFGDLLITPILCVLQQQNFPVATCQRFQRRPHQPRPLLGQQPVERLRRGFVVFGRRLLRRVTAGQLASSPRLATVQQRLANRHSVQPRRNPVGIRQRRSVTNGRQRNFLHHVIDALQSADARIHHRPQPAVVLRSAIGKSKFWITAEPPGLLLTLRYSQFLVAAPQGVLQVRGPLPREQAQATHHLLRKSFFDNDFRRHPSLTIRSRTGILSSVYTETF